MLDPSPPLLCCVLDEFERTQLTGDIVDNFRVGSIMLIVPEKVRKSKQLASTRFSFNRQHFTS
jgi:hypothetical protein